LSNDSLRAELEDLRNLRLLRAIKERGSLTRAAAACRITQPSASARIARLERMTGLSLLARTPGGSRLTKDGERLLERALDVLQAADDLWQAVRRSRGLVNMSLRVAASYTIAEYLFNGWLELAGGAKDAQIELVVGNSTAVCEMIRSEVAELGFIESPTVPQDLDSIVVGHDELAVVVSKRHPWAATGTTQPANLAASRLVLREKGSGTREYVEAELVKHFGEPIQPWRELGSTTAVKSAVLTGMGVGVLSRLTVAREISAGDMVEIRIDELTFRRALRAVLPRGTVAVGLASKIVSAARDDRNE